MRTSNMFYIFFFGFQAGVIKKEERKKRKDGMSVSVTNETKVTTPRRPKTTRGEFCQRCHHMINDLILIITCTLYRSYNITFIKEMCRQAAIIVLMIIIHCLIFVVDRHVDGTNTIHFLLYLIN